MNLGKYLSSDFENKGFHLHSVMINNKIKKLVLTCALNGFNRKARYSASGETC